MSGHHIGTVLHWQCCRSVDTTVPFFGLGRQIPHAHQQTKSTQRDHAKGIDEYRQLLQFGDSLGNATSVLQNVASTTVGLCTGNVSSLLNVGKSVFSKPANQVSGISTNTSYYNPNQCAIIMQTTPATIPGNFGSTVGYLYRQSAKLGSLNGFTTCMNPRIGNFSDNTPTETERAEIYSLLETGVII